ncbi:hypothetical protein JVU11DRAFT_4675 [Chiua virens]|nr:hypothetical protein JVU11DRAFT_4675 [Chiua virens]
MSKSTLSSVVSSLVRASMGTSVSTTVPDEDLDKHVAELILKEAKQKAENYTKLGIKAYLPEAPDPNAPRPNKRFLSSIIRSTDDHNKTILRAQALAAQEIKKEREEQERRERRAQKSEMGDGRDHLRELGKAIGGARGSAITAKTSMTEGGSTGGADGGIAREQVLKKVNAKSITDASGPHRTDKDRHSRRSEGDRRKHRRHGSREDEKTHRRRRQASRSPNPERIQITSRKRSRSVSPSEGQGRTKKKVSSRYCTMQHIHALALITDAYRRGYDGHRQQCPPGRKRQGKDVNDVLDLSSASPPRVRSPSPLPPPPPRRPRGRPTSSTSVRSPSVSPPPLPPAALPSKMDKYFEDSYDPRLDVAPLSVPTVPKTGLINESDYEAWDAMLELLRQRREDKRRRRG